MDYDDEVLDEFTCTECKVKFGHATNCSERES